MASLSAKPLKAAFQTKNPFSCGGDSLPANLVLMVKLIALGLLMKGYLFGLSDHFLPYWPVFDGMGSPAAFKLTLQCFFLCGVLGIFFSRSVRLWAFILGLVMLVTVVSSREAYANVKFFCGCILVLTALADGKNPFLLLRYQMAIVYFGAWVNKILDVDWRSGQYFEHWMGAILHRETYVAAAAWLPPALLSKIMSWATIMTEAFLSVGFLLKPLFYLTVLAGTCFHSMVFLLAWYDFGVFTIAMLSSYLILARWPGSLAVRFNRANRVHRCIKAIFGTTDWDRRVTWLPEEGKLKLDALDKSYSGFQAFKRLVLYSPVSYMVFAFILGLPNEPFLWIKLKSLQIFLVMFFPWQEAAGLFKKPKTSFA